MVEVAALQPQFPPCIGFDTQAAHYLPRLRLLYFPANRREAVP